MAYEKSNFLISRILTCHRVGPYKKSYWNDCFMFALRRVHVPNGGWDDCMAGVLVHTRRRVFGYECVPCVFVSGNGKVIV